MNDMKIPQLIPEINPNQYPMLMRRIKEHIIGDMVDTQALVKDSQRERAKLGFAINAEKEQQIARLEAEFGIERPLTDNRWWL